MGFSNIPQGYRDLMVVADASFTGNVAYAYIINSGSLTYSFTYLSGNGTAASSARISNYPYGLMSIAGQLQVVPQATYQTILHLMNYSNTNTFKTILHSNSFATIGSGSTDVMVSLVQLTGAITDLSFSTADGGRFFNQGSTVTLYGVRSVGQ
jgi:hypothetical protein